MTQLILPIIAMTTYVRALADTLPASIYYQKPDIDIQNTLETKLSTKNRSLNSNKLNQTQKISKINITSSDPYSNAGEKNPYTGNEDHNNTQKIVLHKSVRKKEKHSLSKSFETSDGLNVFPSANKNNVNLNKSRNVQELSNLSLNSNKSCKSQTSNFRQNNSKFILYKEQARQKVINRIKVQKKKLINSMSKEHPYLETATTAFNKTAIIKDLFDNNS